MLVRCSYCNKEIDRKPCVVKRYKHFFCNAVCSNKFKSHDIVKPVGYYDNYAEVIKNMLIKQAERGISPLVKGG